jgi:hypothetical protein
VWPGLDSNQRATDYESAALPLSYRAVAGSDAITAQRRSGRLTTASGSLALMPLLLADTGLGQTLALLATFLGVGVVANVLIVYAVAQVLGERKQNRENQSGGDSY